MGAGVGEGRKHWIYSEFACKNNEQLITNDLPCFKEESFFV